MVRMMQRQFRMMCGILNGVVQRRFFYRTLSEIPKNLKHKQPFFKNICYVFLCVSFMGIYYISSMNTYLGTYVLCIEISKKFQTYSRDIYLINNLNIIYLQLFREAAFKTFSLTCDFYYIAFLK